MHNVVMMLLPYKECNNFEKELGPEKYAALLNALNEYQSLYFKSAHITAYIEELRAKKSTSATELANILEQRIGLIAKRVPLLKPAVFFAFDKLVNNSDLRNVSMIVSRPRFGERQQSSEHYPLSE